MVSRRQVKAFCEVGNYKLEIINYELREMKVITFLAAFFVGIWFVGLILRAVFSRWLRKRTEEFNRAARQAEREAKRRGRREGEVTVETTRATVERKVNRGVGEYVEFEEITVTEEK
jgi:short subunit dehydrogenase-like uncharacterized protein